jgi:hypothetical protein
MLWITPGPSRTIVSPGVTDVQGESLSQGLPCDPPPFLPLGFSAEKAKLVAV